MDLACQPTLMSCPSKINSLEFCNNIHSLSHTKVYALKYKVLEDPMNNEAAYLEMCSAAL